MTQGPAETLLRAGAVDNAVSNGIRDAKILIADDDPLSRRLLVGILQKQNFRNLKVAEGGRAALELLYSFRPDLVLLDMQMPDIGGLEVCQKARAHPDSVDIPILVQTATVNRREMGNLFAAGASDFLSKPINPSELIARVIVHLERRELLQELREYRERTSLELDAARRMQLELLPSPEVQQALASSTGLRLASFSRSSSEIGGDLWGLLPIDETSFGVFVADFTGHGVTAALNTFRLHALIHEYRSLHHDPSRLLSMLNERLTHLLPRGQFATFLYAVVDHAAGMLRIASAGSPPPIIAAGVEGPSRLFEIAGVPLGIAPGIQYEQRIHAFEPGSRLLLFSDGLPEFAGSSGNRIGEPGLVEAVDACHSDLAPGEVIDGLCRVTGITDAVMLPDDTTIVCVDRRGGPLPGSSKQSALSGDRSSSQAEFHLTKQEKSTCSTG
ncbi:PP2C family protein-serine/threonine phosphatase [Bradyrhizobium roseum]|uniref:PP2C family protein-serine/threonine phosphatase n=1 Tax=Bradyrhizobium roseum TaxID=3056648 RepID=UPI002638AB5C|nr:fused response regulator/phosphatase [Bradyrhizobium roseus]WKA29843.1 fused response regulator/phosphatase [Bradyrhizobium roseus]